MKRLVVGSHVENVGLAQIGERNGLQIVLQDSAHVQAGRPAPVIGFIVVADAVLLGDAGQQADTVHAFARAALMQIRHADPRPRRIYDFLSRHVSPLTRSDTPGTCGNPRKFTALENTSLHVSNVLSQPRVML